MALIKRVDSVAVPVISQEVKYSNEISPKHASTPTFSFNGARIRNTANSCSFVLLSDEGLTTEHRLAYTHNVAKLF